MRLNVEGEYREIVNGSIGRSMKRGNVIITPEKYTDVSREHAKFVLEKVKVKLVDNDSKNGT